MRACRLPQFGDVVEYPLRDIEMQELQDGRTAGVRDLPCHLIDLLGYIDFIVRFSVLIVALLADCVVALVAAYL